MLGDAHQHTVDVVALQVLAGGQQQPPVSASIIGDVCLHMVIQFSVGQEHPLYSCYLVSKKQQLTTPNKEWNVNSVAFPLIFPSAFL